MLDATVVVGREHELRALDTMLEDIPVSSVGMVVRGPAGMGKSTLVDHTCRHAAGRGFRVLRAEPSVTEAPLSYSVLSDLVAADVRRLVDALPPPQARALLVALQLRDPDDGRVDAHSVAAGLRSLLQAMTDERPLLIVIDDAQWLDAASSKALEFAARRLEPQRWGILLAERADEPTTLASVVRSWGGDRARQLDLLPLTLDELQRVLDARLGWVPPHPTLARIAATSGGNPFYALRLAHGTRHDPTPAVPRDLTETLDHQVTELPAGCRRGLLLTALAARPTLSLVGRALGDDAAGVLEPAERTDVVLIDDGSGRITFTHPLLASTVVQLATTAQRHDAHAALAGADPEPENRARHLALSSSVPDEAVAHVLEDAARGSLQRGATTAAVELCDLSVRATTDVDHRDRRLLFLGEALLVAGDYARAGRVLDPLRTSPASSTRRDSCLLLARLTSAMGTPSAAISYLHEALPLADSTTTEAAVRVELALMSSHDPRRGLAEALRACVLLSDADAPGALVARAKFAIMDCSSSLGQPLDPALADAVPDAATDRSETRVADRIGYRLGNVLLGYDDIDRTRAVLEHALCVADDEGDEGSRPRILDQLAQLEVIAGRWAAARSHATRQREGAVRTGQLQIVWAADETLASIDVREGRFSDAASRLDMSLTARRGSDDVWEDAYCLRTRGLLLLLQGDPPGACADFAAVHRACTDAGVTGPGVLRYEGDQIEALVLAGHLDEAQTLSMSLEARGRISGSVSSQSAALRGSALAAAARGELDEALASAVRSAALARSVSVPLELGRSLVVLGQVHRRRREKRLANDALTESVEVLSELGAHPWLERAENEARRVGMRTTRHEGLTATEEQVAQLAAEGLSNPEIAARLSMSRKTVEFNLGKVYRKLHVSRRGQLARVLDRTGGVSTPGDTTLPEV